MSTPNGLPDCAALSRASNASGPPLTAKGSAPQEFVISSRIRRLVELSSTINRGKWTKQSGHFAGAGAGTSLLMASQAVK